jgi:alkylated DNA nucleotide flippase Atl1
MAPLFASKGDRPEWRMIYEDLLADADFGAIITYAQIAELLGRPFEPNRGPLYRARQDLGSIKHRWLEAVPGTGYRVVEANEHVRLSVAHRRKSRRQLAIATRVLTATDLEKLSGTGLAEWDTEQKATFALWAIVAHEHRIRQIEEVLRKEGLL